MTDALIRRLQALQERLAGRRLSARARAELTAALERAERALEDAPKAAAAAAGAAGAPAGNGGAPAAPGDGGLIRVWCDGSCAPNPGPGGWGAIVEQDGRRRELSGAAPQSTNNIMELTAAIEALRTTPPGARVHVVTDSRYLMDGITRWLPGWKRKGWRKADGKPVLNQPQWQALEAVVRERQVRWEWVESHTGHPENERCDTLANAARRAL
jgi:ribonuclease HI